MSEEVSKAEPPRHDEQEDADHSNTASATDTVVTLSSEMSSAAVGVNTSNKHGTVKKSSRWLRDSHYEWLKMETGADSDTVVGLFCTLCKKHSRLPRNGTATWVTVPC